MAFQWVDNFQQYGTTVANLLNGPYAENNGCALVADPDATAGGTTVLKLQAGTAVAGIPWGTRVRKVLNPTVTTVGAMLRVWISAFGSDVNTAIKPIWFTDGSNNTMVSIRISLTGTIQVWRSNTNAPEVLLGESAPVIVTNAWQRIEAKVLMSATVGTVRVDVERTTVLNLTGLNTQGSGGSTSAANVIVSNAYFGSGSSPDMYVKDFIVWDTTGAVNNDVLGTCFVYSMRPNGDVSGTWTITGGAGSAYASINESNPDDDTKYISSPFPAATADVLTLGDLPASATRVLGMMALARSRKSDGGDGNLQVSMVSGASTGNGADRAITTAYTYWQDMFETDPATSAAWTVSAANAANVKFNRTL